MKEGMYSLRSLFLPACSAGFGRHGETWEWLRVCLLVGVKRLIKTYLQQ